MAQAKSSKLIVVIPGVSVKIEPQKPPNSDILALEA